MQKHKILQDSKEMQQNPVICAIDTTDVTKARTFSQQLSGHVGALKLGLEFFTANGAAGVQQIASAQSPVFLDLKFHDIPNTVSKAIKATAGIDAFIMTVHTAGGHDMMKAAADAASENAAKTGKRRPYVVGVTVLTSMDQNDLSEIGVRDAVADQVKRLAELAQKAGLDGVVCSPHEIEMIKKTCGKDFKLVVPGIRPAGSESGDQKRVLTPREAVQKGADFLVIGRPITESANPAQAAKDILASLA
jgi:orotidine-5'-phosphate decarboxylase